MALLLMTGCERQEPLTPSLSRNPAESTGDNRERKSDAAPPGSPLPVQGEGLGERAHAHRIVALTPGLAELIYAVGAETSLVATVDYADYPDAAKRVPRVGDAFRVDMEKLLALKPDLVLAWTSGTPPNTVAQIRSLGLRVESIEERRFDDVGAALLRMGELTGREAAAKQAAQAFAQGIQALRDRYAQRRLLRVFVQVNREPLYTVNGEHVISDVLSVCRGTNVFADLNQLAPVVGVEAVLKANPDVILSTDGTAQEVREDWHVWPQIRAVKLGHIYAVSPDTTTRATPRLLQGAQAVCAALDQAR